MATPDYPPAAGPGREFRFESSSARTLLGLSRMVRPWPGEVLPGVIPPKVRCCLLDAWTGRLLSADEVLRAEGVWGPRELALYRNSPSGGVRLDQWARGRLAAKEAVRLWARDVLGLVLGLPEIEVLPGRSGRPVVGGAWTGWAAGALSVSISPPGRTAAAAAGTIRTGEPLGLDLEPSARRLSPRVIGRVFSNRERELAARASVQDTARRFLSLWCAKEAAAKVVGSGLLGYTEDIVVREADFASGTVLAAVSERLARLFPEVRRRLIPLRLFENNRLTAAISREPESTA
ncbi:MAG: 4'-phosphopantetheinyl transferase superfamily protein [Thermodesulfobacteriota bacterium]